MGNSKTYTTSLLDFTVFEKSVCKHSIFALTKLHTIVTACN